MRRSSAERVLPDPPVRNLPSLTSLRAVAALMVFAFHLQHHGTALVHVPVVGLGFSGVAFFFVLSGFVLSWTYRPGRPSSFWLRRVARVYPSHLVLLVVAALVPVTAGARGWGLAVPNALLVQAFATDGRVVFAMNSVSWSLSCEIAFYAAFPLVFWVIVRSSRLVRWAIPAVLLTGAAAALVLRPELGGLWFHWPPVRLAEFVLGVSVACELRSGLRLPWVRVWWVVPALIGTMIAVWVVIDTHPLPNELLAVPYAGLILAFALLDLRPVQTRFTRLLTVRPLVYAGEVSFAFYLVHELVIINLRLPGPAWVAAAGALVVSAIAAVLVHQLVELPAQRAVVRHGERWLGARRERRALAELVSEGGLEPPCPAKGTSTSS